MTEYYNTNGSFTRTDGRKKYNTPTDEKYELHTIFDAVLNWLKKLS